MPYFLSDDPHPGNWHNHLCYFLDTRNNRHLLLIYSCYLFIDKTYFHRCCYLTYDIVTHRWSVHLIKLLGLGSLSFPFSAVGYCSAFCRAFHNLISWSVPIGGVLWSSLGWADCGSVCAAYAHCAATSYLAPDVEVPDTMMSLLTSSATLVWRPSIRRLTARNSSSTPQFSSPWFFTFFPVSLHRQSSRWGNSRKDQTGCSLKGGTGQ